MGHYGSRLRMMRRFRQDKRGISNVVTAMLGLIIVVMIVANVFIWNYEMNAVDWERMQERIDVVSAENMNQEWTQNPSVYAARGSTSLVSGGISNLSADDGDYMVFRSYNSGIDTRHFVDSNISNVDSSGNVGTSNNFTAQRYGPDNINDTLTEANTATTHAEAYIYGSAASGWATNPTAICDNNTSTYAQAASVNGPAWTTKETMNLTSTCIGTKILAWVSQSNSGVYTTMNITIANATGAWVLVYSGTPIEGSYQNYTFALSSYTAIGIERYRPSASSSRTARANEIQAVNASWNDPANYRLDIEEQFTNVNYVGTNEDLCIFMGPYTNNED